MGDTDGGQAGMLKPETRIAAQQGIIRKEESQEQPWDKARARQQ